MSKKKITGISLLVIFGLLFLLSLGGTNYDHCYQLGLDSSQSTEAAQRFSTSGCPENAEKWTEDEGTLKLMERIANSNAKMEKFLDENKP